MKRFFLYGLSKNFLLKIIIALLIILGCKNVFAMDFNVTNSITSPSSSSSGRYSGLEIYNTGSQHVYNVGTRYNGQLSRIIFNLPLPDSLGQCFSTNVTYTVTINMATDDWRNKFGSVSVKPYSSYSTNFSNGRVTFVNYKKIYFTFKIPASDTSCHDFMYIDLQSSNLSSTAFTGVSNWNLSSVILTDPTYSNSTPVPVTPTPVPVTPTPDPDYSSIINNQNQNTQSVINNQNQNTQSVINNQNQNTQSVINNQNDNTSNIIDNANNNTQDIIDNANNNTQSIVDTQNKTNDLLGECYNNYLNPNSIDSYTLNGISFNKVINSNTNDLMFIQYSGTATATTFYRVFDGSFTTDTDYFLSGNSNSNLSFYCSTADDTRYSSLIPSGVTFTNCYLRIPEGTSSSGFRFMPMLNKGTTARAYTPYNKQVCSSKLDNVEQSIVDTGDLIKNGIINNQNQNTQDIINNQNQNTQAQIESQKACTTTLIDKQSIIQLNAYLLDSGVVNTNQANNWGITDYIPINTLNKLNTTGQSPSICFYKEDKTLISCTRNRDLPVGSVTLPNNTFYFRASIDNSSNMPTYSAYSCKNGNQAIADSITNPNIEGGTGSNFFNDFTSDDNGGISGIITKPLVLINSLLSNNNLCSDLTFGVKFPNIDNKNVTLPSGCILWNRVPNNVVSLYQLFVVGFCSYYLLKRLFKDVEDLKNPEKDNVEVLDL